jgi:hypothetical protein
MKWAVRLVMVAGLAAAGYWAWTVLSPNPRTVVWRRLEKLAEIASFPANEGQLVKLAAVQKMGGYFSDQIVVNVHMTGEETHEFYNREELVQAIQAGRMSVNSVLVKFKSPRIEIPPGNQEAIIGVALTADINGEKDTVVEDLKIEMKKIDGDWLITHVETVQ